MISKKWTPGLPPGVEFGKPGGKQELQIRRLDGTPQCEERLSHPFYAFNHFSWMRANLGLQMQFLPVFMAAQDAGLSSDNAR